MRDWKQYVRDHVDLPAMKGHRHERMLSELADHLADLEQEQLTQGATDAEAEAHALRWLGDAHEAAAELTRAEPAHWRAGAARWTERREERFRGRGGGWMSVADFIRDLRLALRGLMRRPGFTGIVVLVLAVGIGATTAIFTLVDAVVLSPLPFDDADRLVSVSHSAPTRGFDDVGQTAAWHLTYEDETDVFEDIGMYGHSDVALTGVGDPEAVPVLVASSGLFRALRVSPVVGRLFTPDDEVPGAPAGLLLSHRYWLSRFGGDPGVLGRTLRVDGATWEVVGVVPPVLSGLGEDPALILPMRFNRSTIYVGNIGFGAVARLRDGVTIDEATAELSRVLPRAWEKFPGGPVASSNAAAEYAPVLRWLKADLVGSVAGLLWILLGGVSVVLLVACANVANLMLVRAESKDTEMAVRTAMGADRRRIGWEYLKESLLLGLLGGAGGLALAFAGLRALVAMGPEDLPRLDQLTLDVSALVFAFGASLFAGLFFGVFPVVRQGRSSVVDTLKQGGRAATRGRYKHRAQDTLAVSQIALALVLLTASGLMLRSFQTLRRVDPGFGEPDDVLTFRLTVPFREVPDVEDAARVLEAIARRVDAVPGVDAVAMATHIPMAASGTNVNPFYVDGVAPSGAGAPPMRRQKWIGEGYFESMRIPLLAGRTFTWDDVHNRFPGAIVSESLARQYWGSPDAALGQRVAARPEPVRWHEVVGVAADVRDDGVDRNPPLIVYWPQVTLGYWEGATIDQPQTWRGMGYALRSARVGTPGFLEDVRRAVWEVSPTIPLQDVRRLPELMAQSVARTSFTMVLLSVAAGVALLLGVIGVYGVISYAVSQERRELGMRMALGARGGDVMRMVLGRGLALAGVGLAAGMALALGLTRLMSGLLFQVSPRDPFTLVVVPLGLLVVALFASYLPARKAARLDPMVALRSE